MSKTRSKAKDSSGNVFEDLGLDGAEELAAKAELASQIARAIAGLKITQVEAGKLLGIDQPKVSALVRGQLSQFSTDRLLRFLTVLGTDVEIVLRDHRGARSPGHLRVVAARQ